VEQLQRRQSGTFSAGSVPAARAEGLHSAVGTGVLGLCYHLLWAGASLKPLDSRPSPFPLNKVGGSAFLWPISSSEVDSMTGSSIHLVKTGAV